MVEGVRPITLALQAGWRVRSWLRAEGRRQSDWARDAVASSDGEVIDMSADLLAQLCGRDEPAELLAVVEARQGTVDDVLCGRGMLAVVLDRPARPGNIGAIVRSCDAFGATGMIVTGHGADPFDPQSVTASRGSVFTVPIASAASAGELGPWIGAARDAGARVIGADETAETDPDGAPLAGPVVLVIGNEATGLGRAWKEQCDALVRIPMRGTTSSLNVAVATAVLLYEVDRRRRADPA